jgi:hypothetical protein
MCANRISTFLRSQRDCWKASVRARTRSRPRDSNLNCAIGTRALGVEDDPNVVVDQIVRIVGKEGVDARQGNPCRLRIGQRDFFRRLKSTVAAARIATVAVSLFFIIVSRIESSEIFANGTRCLLRLWPDDRLISGHTPGRVHIRLDQARIDQKRFAADQPRRDTRRHPPSNTRRKALLSRKRSCRARQNTE